MARRALTQSWINREANKKRTKREYVWDEDTTGLGIAFYPGGRSSFIFQTSTTTDGKRKFHRETLGEHTTISESEAVSRHGAGAVDEAKAARSLPELLCTGLTLRDARERAREKRSVHSMSGGGVPSLQASLDDYIALMKRRGRSEKWIDQMQREISRHASDWLPRRIDAIPVEEVLERHEHLTDTSGPYIANRVMRALRAVQNRALKKKGLKGKVANPYEAVEWNREEARPMKTRMGDLPGYLETVLAAPPDQRCHRMIVLLTGCRPHSAESLTWENVDLDARAFRFAAAKSEKGYGVPICDRLVEELLRYRDATVDAGPIFHRGQKALRSIPGIPTCEDWRKVFETVGHEVGVDDLDINRLMSHGKRKKTGDVGRDHYDWRELEAYRPAVTKITDRILEIARLR